MPDPAIAASSRPHLSLVTNKYCRPAYQPWSSIERDRDQFEIRQARSKSDKETLYRFRYGTYLEQANRLPGHTDHKRQCIEDNLDAEGVNLVALRDSKIVGAVRINYAWRSDLGVHQDFYRMREAAGADHPSRTCIVTRLIIDSALKGSTLHYHLCEAWYRLALRAHVRVAFLSSEDDRIFDFSVLGFKAYMGRTWHAEYGQVLPMKLNLLDERYMVRTRSPFLPVLRGWKQSRQPTVQILPL